jgi:hypothetical protein
MIIGGEGEGFDQVIESAQRARIEVHPLKHAALFSGATLIGYKLMQLRRVPGLSGTLIHRKNVLVSK